MFPTLVGNCRSVVGAPWDPLFKGGWIAQQESVFCCWRLSSPVKYVGRRWTRGRPVEIRRHLIGGDPPRVTCDRR